MLDLWLVESMDVKDPLYLLPLGTLNPTDFICGVIMSILRPGKLSIRVCAKPKDSFGIKEKSRIERAEKASRPFAQTSTYCKLETKYWRGTALPLRSRVSE